MVSHMHFLCDEVHQRIGIWRNRNSHTLGKVWVYFGKSMGTNFLGSSHKMGFVAFFNAMGHWREDLCISLVMKQSLWWIFGKSMVTKVLGPSHKMGFVAFSNAMGHRREDLCILLVMKPTIRWESNGREPPILWEKHGYYFSRFSPMSGFAAFSHVIDEKTHVFSMW